MTGTKKGQESCNMADARAQQLADVLTAMANAPGEVPFGQLITAFQSADVQAANHAADALAARYIRGAPAVRRQLHPPLARAVHEQPDTPLSLALSVRLGSLLGAAAVRRQGP